MMLFSKDQSILSLVSDAGYTKTCIPYIKELELFRIMDPVQILRPMIQCERNKLDVPDNVSMVSLKSKVREIEVGMKNSIKNPVLDRDKTKTSQGE
jgi:hypothetical protein